LPLSFRRKKQAQAFVLEEFVLCMCPVSKRAHTPTTFHIYYILYLIYPVPEYGKVKAMQ